VWQPNSSQWRVIWILAIVMVLFWPGAQDRSLAIKSLNWAADPSGKLPRLPGEFSFSDGDDPFAVADHDAQEAEYYRVYQSSAMARVRMRLRDLPDPFESSTQERVLVAMGVLGAVLVWRLGGRPTRS
jgi:hypothetical protein